jgi:hypothetical protein
MKIICENYFISFEKDILKTISKKLNKKKDCIN